MPTIAKSVVFNAEEYRFDVDGKPFPWYLPEHPQVSARKLDDDLYAVDVEFMAVVFDHSGTPCSFEQTEWEQPFICGLEFPWWISEDGVTFTVSRLQIPSIKLTFFAEHVEGITVDGGKIRAVDGRVIAWAKASA